MKLKPFVPVKRTTSTLSDVKEGFKYVLNHPDLRVLISNLFIITLFGLGIATLMPAWAVVVLKGDATTNGFLLAARGFGSLIGALLIAAMGRIRFRGKIWTISSVVMPIMMIVFAYMRWLIPAMLAIAAMGFCFMMIVNLSNAMVQTRIADEMRGRVMGIFTFFFFGAFPLGSLISGWTANIIGEPNTVIACAIILLVFAGLVIWRQPALRAME